MNRKIHLTIWWNNGSCRVLVDRPVSPGAAEITINGVAIRIYSNEPEHPRVVACLVWVATKVAAIALAAKIGAKNWSEKFVKIGRGRYGFVDEPIGGAA